MNMLTATALQMVYPHSPILIALRARISLINTAMLSSNAIFEAKSSIPSEVLRNSDFGELYEVVDVLWDKRVG